MQLEEGSKVEHLEFRVVVQNAKAGVRLRRGHGPSRLLPWNRDPFSRSNQLHQR